MKRVFLRCEGNACENYQAALEACGVEAVRSLDLTLARGCDGLLLPGGGDAAPALYGQEDRGSNPPDPERDRDELELIERFLSQDRPILGICRGHQMLNIALGGTLIQDLPDERHRHSAQTGADRIHRVRSVHPLMMELYGGSFVSNSSHHQAVERLGAGLAPACVSEDGVVEGIVHENGKVLGVQFHPERMAFGLRRADTADGAPIFRWFVSML